MPAEINTRAELDEYRERAGVDGFTDDQYDEALARSVDKMRQAFRNAYTVESFEALTPETAPDEVRDNGLALALGILTKGDAHRPGSITDEYKDACKWLGYVVAGKTHYDEGDGAVLVKRLRGSGTVTRRTRTDKGRTFDRCNPDSRYNAVDPEI